MMCTLKSLKQAEGNKLALISQYINMKPKQPPSYLKSDDKTKSDSKEFPVEQCVVSIVVSECFISKKSNPKQTKGYCRRHYVLLVYVI